MSHFPLPHFPGHLTSDTSTGTNYIETLRVQIHANCRIRRIYFSDRLYTEDELPQEFKLFLPIQVCSGCEFFSMISEHQVSFTEIRSSCKSLSCQAPCFLKQRGAKPNTILSCVLRFYLHVCFQSLYIRLTLPWSSRFTAHKLFVECPREGKVKANVPIP